MINIMWFRNDLRLDDNPALFEAVQNGDILLIYIFDKKNIIGEASQWWLYNSLIALNKSLNNQLNIYCGDALEIIPQLTDKFKIKKIYYNEADNLWSPKEILKKDQSYYQIYGAFYKKCLESKSPREILSKPTKINAIKDQDNIYNLDNINLLPQNKWYKKLEKYWDIGEGVAQNKLKYFIENKLDSYDQNRNYPAKNNTSRLSPHLHFGEISSHQIWHTIQNQSSQINRESFLSEIIWREFSYYLHYHFPELTKENFKPKFNQFSWENNMDYFEAWKKGQTGYPFIDAGMRELWQTGFMHNRVRMITASFLVKNLLIDWRYGEKWFEDCLIDADYANNAMNWQWTAGSGVNPAPYSRIFSPIIQGEKFDKNGDYTLKYIPELANLPKEFLFCPWEAPPRILENSGIILGKNYPLPIINLKESKIKAIEKYNKIFK